VSWAQVHLRPPAVDARQQPGHAAARVVALRAHHRPAHAAAAALLRAPVLPQERGADQRGRARRPHLAAAARGAPRTPARPLSAVPSPCPCPLPDTLCPAHALPRRRPRSTARSSAPSGTRARSTCTGAT
jgi:hypothetical protein